VRIPAFAATCHGASNPLSVSAAGLAICHSAASPSGAEEQRHAAWSSGHEDRNERAVPDPAEMPPHLLARRQRIVTVRWNCSNGRSTRRFKCAKSPIEPTSRWRRSTASNFLDDHRATQHVEGMGYRYSYDGRLGIDQRGAARGDRWNAQAVGTQHSMGSGLRRCAPFRRWARSPRQQARPPRLPLHTRSPRRVHGCSMATDALRSVLPRLGSGRVRWSPETSTRPHPPCNRARHLHLNQRGYEDGMQIDYRCPTHGKVEPLDPAAGVPICRETLRRTTDGEVVAEPCAQPLTIYVQ